MTTQNTAIRVANIIEEGRYGGPQARILAVAERLKPDGIESVIICPANESERFYAEVIKRRVPIRRLQLHRLSKSLHKIAQYILTFPEEVYFLYRLLELDKIDIVHCNSARQFKGVVAGWLAGKKVIWHLNDTWNPTAILSFFYLAAQLADCFILSGKRVQEYYFDRYFMARKPSKIIHPPVDCDIFNPGNVSPDQVVSTSLGKKVVTVGNINPAKGYEYFIEAASYLCAFDEPVKCVIVGSYYPPQRRYFQKLNSLVVDKKLVNVHFAGASDCVQSILKAADVFVCSSIFESGPMSVWEAMAMGKAIVSTDVGDVRQFIQDGVNGFVVPTKNSKALADKIDILLKDARLRESFGAKARATAVKYLDISICARKHAEFYRQVLGK